MSPEPTRLAGLTAEEAAAALDRDAVLLLPVGSTEAHGPHLPLETDVLLAEEAARRAARALCRRGIGSLLLPPLAYARADCAASFPGTVSVSDAAVRALVLDIARSLAPAGGPLLCVVNAHLEPEHVRCLRGAVEAARSEGCRAVFADQTRRPWVEELGEEFRQGGGHAGGYETSLALAAGGRVEESIRISLPANRVDLASALRSGDVDFRAIGGDRAYFGEPAGASAAEGERLFDVLVRVVLNSVEQERGRAA